MHKFMARAAKIISRYTAVALVLSMMASTAVAQSSRSQLLNAPQGMLELLEKMQPGRGVGVGQGALSSELDIARERQNSRAPDRIDPRFYGLEEQSAPPSRIEKDYSDRSDEALTQFGYDLFSGGPSDAPLVGAVQDSYVLGVG
ncbi:MAG: hypothetical protein ACKVK8_04400, partial [Rhodospirillales bacterium]